MLTQAILCREIKTRDEVIEKLNEQIRYEQLLSNLHFPQSFAFFFDVICLYLQFISFLSSHLFCSVFICIPSIIYSYNYMLLLFGYKDRECFFRYEVTSKSEKNTR